MLKHVSKASRVMAGLAVAALSIPHPAAAQWTALDPIPAGTAVEIRTTEAISSESVDGRIYTGTVENDVRDTQGRLAIPAGSTAELVVRRDQDNDLVLDLDSVTINARRYAVDATRNRLDRDINLGNAGIGANKETAKHVGGGAVLGAILGAVIGGGDAAAKGAIAGAAAGAGVQILTKGRRVNVPAETLLSYRLQSDISLDVRDNGYDRDGRHYHRYENN